MVKLLNKQQKKSSYIYYLVNNNFFKTLFKLPYIMANFNEV